MLLRMTRPPKQVPLTVQPLSIQYIHLGRTQKYLKLSQEKFEKTQLDLIIEGVITVYNQSKQSNKRETFHFMPERKSPLTGYKVRIYGKVHNSKTRLVRKVEEISGEQLLNDRKTEFVVFCYRKEPKEIFALTTGQAWEAVRPCVDYQFPPHIAERMLDSTRITKIARRYLVGADAHQTLISPAGHDLYRITNLYQLVESFESYVKSGNSFMDLGITTIKPKVSIATGLVKVNCQISLGKYSKILDLFSRYYQNKKSLKGVDPGFQFLHYLQPAQIASTDLNHQLVKKAWENYSKGKEQTASFRHKKLEDYLSATHFKLIRSERSEVYTLPEQPPTLEEIIDYLVDLLPEHEEMDAEILLRELSTWKLKYDQQDACSLITCLEGEVRYEDKTYFKARNMWYELSVDFNMLLYADYLDFLRQALIPRGQEGDLPRPWAGNERKGYLTQAMVQKKLGITQGIRSFMEKLKTTKVSFLDTLGYVNQKWLVGEILKVPVIQKHRDNIDKLLGSLVGINKQKLQQYVGDDATAVFDELNKQRPVLKDGNQKFVLNPFLYPLIDHPFLKGDKYKKFITFLEGMCVLKDTIEDEESYNRSYGSKQDYLVFDQIIPNNIELCDIAYFSPDTTYLYAVKETFGQPTRVACSQILNAAKELRSALSTNAKDHYLKQLWEEAVPKHSHESPWRQNLKAKLKHLGEKEFFNHFFERKVVFVYAFLEDGKRSLHKEVKRPSSISLENLYESQEDIETYSQMLLEKGFIDERGRITGKFMGTSKQDFLPESGDNAKTLYDHLKTYAPQSKSTIAKLELIRLSQELRSLNFDLKICEIRRPQGEVDEMEVDENPSDTPPASRTPLPLSREFSDISPPSSPSPSPDLGRHMKNIGNSCYIAATLQMMFNIPEVCAKIRETSQPGNLANRLKKALDDREVDLVPLRARIFDGSNSEFSRQRIGEQHDAHELLLHLFQQLGGNLESQTASVALTRREAPFQSFLTHIFQRKRRG